MSRSLVIQRDRSVPVDTKLLGQLGRTLLREWLLLEEFDLGIHLVRASKMTQLNETFLQHAGSTDVITFNYSDSASALHGEIFISYDDAVSQARQFRTTWQSEMVRYLVHGVLHLRGFDDHRKTERRKMKREENQLLRELKKRFPISRMERGCI